LETRTVLKVRGRSGEPGQLQQDIPELRPVMRPSLDRAAADVVLRRRGVRAGFISHRTGTFGKSLSSWTPRGHGKRRKIAGSGIVRGWSSPCRPDGVRAPPGRKAARDRPPRGTDDRVGSVGLWSASPRSPSGSSPSSAPCRGLGAASVGGHDRPPGWSISATRPPSACLPVRREPLRPGLARMDVDGWGRVGRAASSSRGPSLRGRFDLFGRGSLFELLCTVRTRAGEKTLARWLLSPGSRRKSGSVRSPCASSAKG